MADTEYAMQPSDNTIFNLPTDFTHGQILRFHASSNAKYEIRSEHPICVFGSPNGMNKAECHVLRPDGVAHLELEGVVVLDSKMKPVAKAWVSRRVSGSWYTE